VTSSGNVGKAATTIRDASRIMKEGQDVGRAEDTVEAVDKMIADLNAQAEAEATELSASVDPQTEQFETITIKPKKTNINVQICTLVWAPYWKDAQGTITPAWE
jgi:hypothetical protein